jgi:hypothetical protein
MVVSTGIADPQAFIANFADYFGLDGRVGVFADWHRNSLHFN